MLHHPQIKNAQNQFHILNTTLSKTHSVVYFVVAKLANMKTISNTPQIHPQLLVFILIKLITTSSQVNVLQMF